MRHLFIVNPVAGGNKKHIETTISNIHSVMQHRSETYEIHITKAPMDACDKIRQSAERAEPLRVYACGGDGTLNECVNGSAGLTYVTVTHYPCGTGNDFIRMFGPEDASKFHDLEALVDGEPRPVDLIEVRTDSLLRYGINICSVGIDARIGIDVHKYSGIPLIGGATGYVISMVVNLIKGINRKLKITTEHDVRDGSFALICACNGRYYGGGFNPVPEAMPDDGLIDFLLISAVSRLKFITVVGKYAKGRYKEFRDIISHIKGNTMKIESAEEMCINVDGEMLRSKAVVFSVVPRGVRFLFPAGMNFFGSNDDLQEDLASNLKI